MNRNKKRTIAGILLAAGMVLSFAVCVYADTAVSDIYGSSSRISNVGPGGGVIYQDALTGIINDTQSGWTGPKVENITLTEAYYDEFECYSEGFNGAAYIYSNVGNNVITDQSVYVDIPANVSYRLEKDGIEIPYVTKSRLSGRGSYRFQLEVVKNPEDPVADQVLYKAVFNFRIADRVKPAQGNVGSTMDEPAYTPLTPGQNDPGLPYVAMETAAEEIPQETQSVHLEFVDDPEIQEEQQNLPEEAELPEEPEMPETELSFNPVTGFYSKEFADGTVFRANTASGMPVNYAVQADCSGLRGDVKVFCDGQEIELPEDEMFTEAGEYDLQIPDGTGVYHYRFRIFSHPVTGPLSLSLPKGTELSSFTLDGREQRYLTAADGSVSAELSEEGTYVLQFTDENLQSYETTIVLDQTPPAVDAEQSGKGIVIRYDREEEIDHVTIHKGKKEYDQSILYEIKEPGEYKVDFYDEAGNVTTLTFVLKKSINIASVIAVLLIIGILACGAFFFWKIRNKSVIK